MTDGKIQLYFFIIILTLVSVLMFFIFYPFLGVLAVAALIAFLLYPLYEKIKSFIKSEWLSSLAVIFLSAVFILIPLLLLGWQIFQEAQSVYIQIAGSKNIYLDGIAEVIEGPLRNIVPGFTFNLGAYTSQLFNWFVNNIGPVITGTTQTLFALILVIISSFFFLKDGHKLRKMLVNLSPLDDKYDNLLIEKIEVTVESVIKGSLLIAVAQGLLAGIGFWVFGVPNPALWGTIAVVTSLVPSFGTGLIMVPVIAYLLIVGNYIPAIGLSLWGLLLVGTADQFLRPLLYSKGVPAHPLFVLFSVLGGLAFFGPIGIVFGPVILSIYLTLLEIYKCFDNPNQPACK